MPKILLVSTDVLWNEAGAAPHKDVVETLQKVTEAGNLVVLISVHPEPPWFSKHFPYAKFCACGFDERKNGLIVDRLLAMNVKHGLKHSDMVVFGTKDADFFMAVLKQVLFVRCDWSQAADRERASKYGIPLSEPLLILGMTRLLESGTPWYYQHHSDGFSVYALTNAGTLGVQLDAPARNLIDGLRNCLKQGDPKRKLAFQVHLLSSLYATEGFRGVDIWSYYPGSTSSNQGDEVMAGFCELARTAYGPRTKGPLFIRHTPCASRHQQRAEDDRTDPTLQVQTVHLNPAYRAKLKGATVAVLDDFLTHGVSFGVAAALLQAAGAKKVICVAMGKFGRKARDYPLQIKGDPFLPVLDYHYAGCTTPVGAHTDQAQLEFINKFTAIK